MFMICVFFFKQKTAYEMQRGLVGSEMCIRDRYKRAWIILDSIESYNKYFRFLDIPYISHSEMTVLKNQAIPFYEEMPTRKIDILKGFDNTGHSITQVCKKKRRRFPRDSSAIQNARKYQQYQILFFSRKTKKFRLIYEKPRERGGRKISKFKIKYYIHSTNDESLDRTVEYSTNSRYKNRKTNRQNIFSTLQTG
eukprot:TRINITY_DN38410_c0_g1_i1.p1 TRINITY_DN38410_c0_g1~~TRINITY_DN38410_c0_g1_i1.p1  ORF type:complete len:195 (+),score=31.57 TRINITY_DN38410_c0_g1_i1:22-606(+)